MNQLDSISVDDFQVDSLPQYYRENYFSSDTLFYTERTGYQYGIAGDPVPYTVRNDNLLTSLLLICFVFLVISITRSKRFINRQIKDIFFFSYNDNDISETSSEIRFQFVLVILSCLVLAIITFQYVEFYFNDTFIIDSNLLLITVFFALFISYFALKAFLYSIVNCTFFNEQLNKQWQKLLLFIISSEGVLLFPATMLLVYFDSSPKKILYYFISIVVLLKILTIYKCWNIFFSQKGGFLQTILYFCTLEIVPLLNLAGGILILIDNLKFNF